MHSRQRILSSIFLILSCLSLLLVAPLFNVQQQRYIFTLIYTVIFLSALMTIGGRKHMVLVVLFLILLQFTGQILKLEFLEVSTFFFNVLFFTYVVIRLIMIIARKKEVNIIIILDAISAYLLIGLVFFLFNLVVSRFVPGAFQGLQEITGQPDQILYYTIVTFTTLGYGDISPAIPLSRSLAMLCALTGQVYLTIVIALIVGKYLKGSTSIPD